MPWVPTCADRRMSRFPDPRTAPGDEPLAYGGDLRIDTLCEAYRRGIFPWPGDSGIIWWWSPDPRAVIPIGGLHVSRSLRRTLHAGRLRCTSDTAFDAVVAACAHRPGEGTWITAAMRAAYAELHRAGRAHSIEVWDDGGRVVGGLYGVTVGRVFCGESMFHRVTDASKVAMVAAMRVLSVGRYDLFDVQLPTAHLRSMGAVDMTRSAYLDLLGAGLPQPARWDPAAAESSMLG
ncbi:MAG: leucyl/phenylalanyl-tRNA--protein transferase [Actinobacteria bacterium]|nr:leucyl/phenylalanyl-tRNA--protein transferase [Actinomycetota bacterium]